MRLLSLYLIVFLISISCRGPVLLEQKEFTGPHDRLLSYQEATHKKKAPLKTAIILNDNPDTLKISNSQVVTMLVKNDYRVIIPGKPGKNAQERLELDQKSYRAQDITQLILETDSSSERRLILIGFGEGGYLLPKIAHFTNPYLSIIINAGPYSVLTEYENLLRSPDDNKDLLNRILLDNLLYTNEELAERIENIKENETGPQQLGGGSNYYWLSYEREPLLDDIIKMPGKGVWIVSEDFPLISNENKKMVNTLCRTLPMLNYRSLEGNGNFNNEQQMKSLTEAIEAMISSQN